MVNLPVNHTTMALTLCHNSFFFLESPLLKIGTFFHSKRSHLNKGYPKNCIFEKDHHLHKLIHFHKNQAPTGLKEKTTKNKQPRNLLQKYSVLPSNPLPTPPPHLPIPLAYFFISGTSLSCCVLVCKNTCTVYLMPKAPWWAYVCTMYVCVCVQISSLKPLGQLKPR